MESDPRDVPRWQRDVGWVFLGAVLIASGILATCREYGESLVIAGCAVLGAALVHVLIRVRRPSTGELRRPTRAAADAQRVQLPSG